jgi:hypothetical protein
MFKDLSREVVTNKNESCDHAQLQIIRECLDVFAVV